MPREPSPETVAAVDLGSNSFHMVVARREGAGFTVLDRIRERVQLAAGLDPEQNLTEEAQERALACLERFGQGLRGIPAAGVRVVGTNTLRKARNAALFVRRAARALGHPVEIVSGREEARLIYVGVARDLAPTPGRRLVVDVGGGSTEVILGEGPEPILADSLDMGCVSFSRRFFPKGRIGKDEMRVAEIAARLELETIEGRYRALGWDAAIGSSGTALAVAEVLRENGWAENGLTLRGLKRLRRAVLDAGRTDDLDIPGLKEDRRNVLPGGLAILLGAFEALGIESMVTSGWALQEGVLCDLVGRIRNEDVRDHTVLAFARRYQVDAEQAARVERTALALLEQAAKDWDLEGPDLRRLLGWAARLHEVGVTVSYSGYHKHGGYLLLHSDMPGFSREDQATLAALVRAHRRRLADEAFEASPASRREATLRLAVLLRLAVRLHRSRQPRPLPRFRLEVSPTRLDLRFPSGWLDGQPLTKADLEEEAAYLDEAGLRLSAR
jgi:exopolyphosphatase/guanosine-5'-triphosphate,3'-diphosphate pyrophosphatase